MTRTRVKICGITRIADGVAAAQAGADAIGFVFWPGSPRAVAIEQARTISAALPLRMISACCLALGKMRAK